MPDSLRLLNRSGRCLSVTDTPPCTRESRSVDGLCGSYPTSELGDWIVSQLPHHTEVTRSSWLRPDNFSIAD